MGGEGGGRDPVVNRKVRVHGSCSDPSLLRPFLYALSLPSVIYLIFLKRELEGRKPHSEAMALPKWSSFTEQS
jgi:hypothetical protein